eukprot:TRINITY_DN47061_c0_g1_i1.p1 TRINITY_DN47061_c0_g1~~TRINITY_DN47061_c0_g1_i1.p1  ORF type:complete len:978 (+),score=151.58 TRINITY_DN47061_c0_g1_i1:64-2997(+)
MSQSPVGQAACAGDAFAPLDRKADGGSRGVSGVTITIPRTEEKSSMGGLKPYTAYCVEVNDFGTCYTVERRFDDFQKLRADLAEIDSSLPHLPEKKMWGSTDASVVAERRPAFEKLLNYMLRSEEVVFESENHLWKFIEIPTPGVVAARYLFRKRRIAYVKQCMKLLDEKYKQEHSYRLCHESMLAAHLQLLSSEGQLVLQKAPAMNEDADGSPSAAPAAQRADGPKGAQVNDPDLEGGVLEMLRYGISNGKQSARKRFVEEDGIRAILDLIRRIAKRSEDGHIPNQRARNVLSALVQADGDNFPTTFADFLRKGGVGALSEFRELCGKYPAYAEFLGKLLWLAWEVDTQAAFLQADSSGGEALALLSALFASGTKSGQIMAGLLLSSLVANDGFANDRSREAKAAQGISGLVEDLVASMPTMTGPTRQKESSVADDDMQAAETFLASVGRNERSFARLLACATAPCDPSTGSVFAHGTSPRWSPCAFALWCLAKIKPKPARLLELRTMLPALAEAGDPTVRWLSGELLLHLHSAGSENAGTSEQKEDQQGAANAATIATEQRIVDAAMSEQILHVLAQLRDGLQENAGVMQQQFDLVQAREGQLAIASDGGWSEAVDTALKKLTAVREKLSRNMSSVRDRHQDSKESLDTLHRSLDDKVDAKCEADLEAALASVQELEDVHYRKHEEWSHLQQVYEQQNLALETATNEMEEADRKVAGMRKIISDMEQELSNKQREAHTQRSLASSDRGAAQANLRSEMEKADQRLAALREKAAKLQASQESGQPAVDPAKIPELMAQLKQDAQKCKQRKAELQDELQKLCADPEAIEAAAQTAERQAVELQEQLATLRTSGLTDLERAHFASREVWRDETTRLQEVRVQRDSAGRERDEFKRQMDERWRRWNQLWSARLKSWRERAIALGDSRSSNRGFQGAVSETWDLLREEQVARQNVLEAVAGAQQRLQRLAEQMVEVGDIA